MVVSSDETSPLIPLSPQPLSSIQRHRHRRESFETGFPLVVATEIDVQSTVQESEADSPRASVSVSPCQWLGHNCAVPFTLLMSAIGAGTLAVPYTFVLLSPVQAVLLLCCVGLAMAFTADTLVGVHVAVVTQSVDELQESRETYQHLAWRAGVRQNSKHAVATTVWVIVLVVVLPLGCLTKISALRFSSYFGVAFSVYLVGAVAYRAAVGGVEAGDLDIDVVPVSEMEYEASLFWRVSEAVGIYNFTFMLHLNVIPLLAQLVAADRDARRKLHDKDIENVGGTEAPVAVDLLQTAARTMRRHLALAVGVCILLYATFGICAAHIYGSKTQGNILLNLSNDRIMAVPRMYMACTSRNTPEEENGSAPSQFVQAVGTVSLLVAQIICALRVPGLQVVFSFVGASILLMLCYLFPLIFYVRLTSWRSSRKEIARLAILSSVGLVATVFCVAATLQLVFPA
ncbi:Transmembrane amino acid transporter protein [Phytophthora infestans]|uniref:Transmembrane amino acid transporter protein n=1 Tax=Phytophthora infestans TaxID=4787 RepID=A0A833SQ90_PHYIN|nr:Transmembrane amino acid transporter protein [Phytophthora infestans]